MVHIDTSEGTEAVSAMQQMDNWSGDRIPYPENNRLQVSIDNYPKLETFRGEDLLFGPGRSPIGLDDKVGMAELMTLGQILSTNPDIPHGEILLVFRPDEEIGRMAAVEGLAEQFETAGVQYGYTIDGIAPFEISIENFNASGGQVAFVGEEIAVPSNALVRTVDISVTGVTTHGDSAKEEGHLNALTVAAGIVDALSNSDVIIPAKIESDIAVETNAQVQYLLVGDSVEELDRLQQELEAAYDQQLLPHAWKGAHFEVSRNEDGRGVAVECDDAARQLLDHVRIFLAAEDPATPLLPENSDGRQGYTNPFSAYIDDGKLVLHYRIRDFDEAGLRAREEYVRSVATASGVPEESVAITQQYVNMGPLLSQYPELVSFARDAATPLSNAAHVRPIRGGTGVDPFIERNIPIANLGTGYWAPESEKEITSKQALARSTQWLSNLVQRLAFRDVGEANSR
jgi:tripeptide aminopeptidase